MNSPKMSIAQWGTVITSVAVVAGLVWCLNETVVLGRQTAAVIESQSHTDAHLNHFQEVTEAQNSKTSDDIKEVTVRIATTQELVSLISEHYQIDPAAVGARVKKEIDRQNQATDTPPAISTIE